MLRIRLQRVGRTNDPSFRILVVDSQSGPKSGNFIENVGSYDARRGKPNLKAERINHWLSQGAQASDTVHNMLVKFKVIEGQTKNVLPKMKPVEKSDVPEKKDEPKQVETEAKPEPEDTEPKTEDSQKEEVKADEPKPEEVKV